MQGEAPMKIDLPTGESSPLLRAIKVPFSMPFLYLASLYLLLRLAVAASCFPYIYTSEDIYTMKLVDAWFSGQSIWQMVRPSSFIFGGDLLNALLFFPFGWLFGPSYFNLKVFTIIEGLAIMGMWYYLIRSCFGRAPAVLFGLLYTLAPHYFVIYSMIAYGYHFETGLIQVATCILFIRLIKPGGRGKAKRSRMILAFAVGIAIGVGLFWSYLFLITLGAIGAVWLFNNALRIGLKPSLTAAFTGLLVAAALYYGTCTRLHFWGVHSEGFISLRPDYLSELWHNIISVSDDVRSQRVQVPDLSPGRCDALFGAFVGFAHPGNILYHGMFFLALIAQIPLAILEKGYRRSIVLLILFDIIFFYLFYTQISFSRFGLPFRVTLYPFVFAAVSLLPTLSRSLLLRIPYGLALSVILGMGLFNAVSNIEPSRLGIPKDFRALEYSTLTDSVDPPMVAGLNAFLDWYNSGPPETKQLSEGLSDALDKETNYADFAPETRWYRPLSPDQVAHALEVKDKDPAYMRGFCWAASLRHGQDVRLLFEALDSLRRLHCIEGIGMARAAAGEPREADPTIVQEREEIEAMARGRDLFER